MLYIIDLRRISRVTNNTLGKLLSMAIFSKLLRPCARNHLTYAPIFASFYGYNFKTLGTPITLQGNYLTDAPLVTYELGI
jgi:hypothetical protein